MSEIFEAPTDPVVLKDYEDLNLALIWKYNSLIGIQNSGTGKIEALTLERLFKNQNYVFVDGKYGVDVDAQKYKIFSPYKTVEAAYAAASPGDTIWVWPWDQTYDTYDATAGEYATIGDKDGISFKICHATIDWYYNAEGNTGSVHNISGSGTFLKTQDDGYNTFRIRADGITFNMEALEVTNTSGEGDAFGFASDNTGPGDPSVEIRIDVQKRIHSDPQYAIGLTRKVKGYINCPEITNKGIGGAVTTALLDGTTYINGNVLSDTGDDAFSSAVLMSTGNTVNGNLIVNGNCEYTGPSDNSTAGTLIGLAGNLIVNGNVKSDDNYAVNMYQSATTSVVVNGDIDSININAVILNNPNGTFEHHGKCTVVEAGSVVEIEDISKGIFDGIYTNEGPSATDHGFDLIAAVSGDIEFWNVTINVTNTSAKTINESDNNSITYLGSFNQNTDYSSTLKVLFPNDRVFQYTRLLSQGEVQGLGTPLDIIPALGAFKGISVVEAIGEVPFAGSAYTTNMTLQLSTSAVASDYQYESIDLMNASGQKTAFFAKNILTGATSNQIPDNLSLKLQAPGGNPGGGGDSGLRLSVMFKVIPVNLP